MPCRRGYGSLRPTTPYPGFGAGAGGKAAGSTAGARWNGPGRQVGCAAGATSSISGGARRAAGRSWPRPPRTRATGPGRRAVRYSGNAVLPASWAGGKPFGLIKNSKGGVADHQDGRHARRQFSRDEHTGAVPHPGVGVMGIVREFLRMDTEARPPHSSGGFLVDHRAPADRRSCCGTEALCTVKDEAPIAETGTRRARPLPVARYAGPAREQCCVTNTFADSYISFGDVRVEPSAVESVGICPVHGTGPGNGAQQIPGNRTRRPAAGAFGSLGCSAATLDARPPASSPAI